MEQDERIDQLEKEIEVLKKNARIKELEMEIEMLKNGNPYKYIPILPYTSLFSYDTRRYGSTQTTFWGNAR